MAARAMQRLPSDSVLRRKAKRVPTIDRSIQRLIDDMVATMHQVGGVGLAAPQIGVSLRVVVLQMPGEEPIAIVNPEIVKRSLGKVRSTEGCLSFPGKKVIMIRDKLITVKGFDANWNPIKLKLRGLAGMCVQHEIDHLNGVTIV